MPTIDDIERRLAALESSRFNWSRIAPYLPAVRSLLWAFGGMVGGGAIGGFAIAPAPIVTEKIIHTKEVATPSATIKSGEGPPKAEEKK